MTWNPAEGAAAGRGRNPSPPGQLRLFLLMVRWQFLSLRTLLPLLIVVQMLVASGMVIGLGFLFEDVSSRQALYLMTGGTVIALLLLGLVAAPQTVAQSKMQKTYDFMLALPVPRWALALSAAVVWMAVALPGMMVALFAAAFWYGLQLHPTLLLAPATLLTVLAATSIGFGVAHVLPNPAATAVVTQVLAFVMLFYSPINFPPDRLPAWLEMLHRGLPFQHAAVLMRGALAPDLAAGVDLSFSFLVLSLWVLVSWLLTLWILNRRP